MALGRMVAPSPICTAHRARGLAPRPPTNQRGLPMPTVGSKTYAARVRSGDIEKLEEQLQGISFSEWTRQKIENSGKSEGLPDVPDSVHRDNAAMAKFGLMTYSELIIALNEGLNDGSLAIENGKIVGRGELDLSEFYEVCHEKNIEPEEAIKKCVMMLWK